MTHDPVVDASLFAQLQPHALSRQEALLFSSLKDEYFKARDSVLLLWHRKPCDYLTFEACMADGQIQAAGPELAWRAFTFLTKNGYINAGLVHANATQKTSVADGTQPMRIRPVCNMPVRPLRPSVLPAVSAAGRARYLLLSAWRLK
jgi:SWIRM domain